MQQMDDDIDEQIRRVNANEPGAQDALFAAAYAELCKLAKCRLRGSGGDALLGTSTLVHESYLRFTLCGRLRSSNRRAFFAYASQVMRSVIVDTARERNAVRRGGADRAVTLDTQIGDALPDERAELIWIHEALDSLAEAEPRLAKVVEMRYFGGYSETEIGDALQLTERTVRRDWDKARLLLGAMLKH